MAFFQTGKSPPGVDTTWVISISKERLFLALSHHHIRKYKRHGILRENSSRMTSLKRDKKGFPQASSRNRLFISRRNCCNEDSRCLQNGGRRDACSRFASVLVKYLNQWSTKSLTTCVAYRSSKYIDCRESVMGANCHGWRLKLHRRTEICHRTGKKNRSNQFTPYKRGCDLSHLAKVSIYF